MMSFTFCLWQLKSASAITVVARLTECLLTMALAATSLTFAKLSVSMWAKALVIQSAALSAPSSATTTARPSLDVKGTERRMRFNSPRALATRLFEMSLMSWPRGLGTPDAAHAAPAAGAGSNAAPAAGGGSKAARARSSKSSEATPAKAARARSSKSSIPPQCSGDQKSKRTDLEPKWLYIYIYIYIYIYTLPSVCLSIHCSNRMHSCRFTSCKDMFVFAFPKQCLH